jgi:hypothetical protein
VSGQFYAVVGRVTMLGAFLEQRLLELLWAVDGGPQPLHAGKPVAQLMKLIDEGLVAYPESVRAGALQQLGRAKLALEDRNAIVHSLWPDPSLKIAFRWRPRTLKHRANEGEWMQGEFVTRNDLRAVVGELIAVIDELTGLTQRLHSVPRSP